MQRRATGVQGSVPQVRGRGDPPRRRQARRRGVDAVGGHQGRARVGPSRDRAPAAAGQRPRRSVLRDLRRGASLGVRRDRPRDLGFVARRRRPRRIRHPRADRQLGPRVLRHRTTRSSSAPTPSPSRRPAPTSRASAPRRSSTATSGCSTAPRSSSPTAGSPTSTWSSPPSTRARPPGPGLLRDPQGHAGPRAGQEGVEARHPRLSHRRGDPRGLPHPGREPARRHGEARAQARARPLGRVQRPGLQRARHLRADAAGRRRLGARHRPGRVRVDPVLPRQRWLGGPGGRVPRRELHRRAGRRSSGRGSSSALPTWPPRSRRRACSSSARRGWVATASR